jgi:pilus assembly protein Flp/PilA
VYVKHPFPPGGLFLYLALAIHPARASVRQAARARIVMRIVRFSRYPVGEYRYASSLGAPIFEIFDKGGETRMLFLQREEGQGLVEYALVLVLVAIVVIAILTLLGPQIGNVFSRITSGLG